MPAGTALDLGATGKAFAADLVAATLAGELAGSALVTVTVSATLLPAFSTPRGYVARFATVDPRGPISSIPTRSARRGRSAALCGSYQVAGSPGRHGPARSGWPPG